MRAGELVLHLLSSIGSAKEARFYVSLFRAERPESFAIIAVADTVMRHAEGALLVDLRFLARLGLTPVVQFGVIDPGDARAHAERVARVLSPDVACQVTTAERARDLAARGVIPLIPAAQRPEDGTQEAVDARFDGLAQLATELATRKLVVLGRKSGLEPDRGTHGEEEGGGDSQVISLVDLTTEYDGLCPRLPADEVELLRQARRLMNAVPQRLTVAVTSPLDLLRELFTVRGAGTLLRLGSTIERHRDYERISLDRLRALIESAFDKRLRADFFQRPIESLYLAGDYLGLAIVEETAHGPYLTKFAVDRRAQGEGVGRDLWRALTRDHDRLLWRGRADNPIGRWYREVCDGMIRVGAWHVFWRGLAPERLPTAIEFARSARADFA